MPVNWAFPAAKGEPESFLAILGPMYCCKSFCWRRIFSVQESFCICKSIPGSACCLTFFLHAQ